VRASLQRLLASTIVFATRPPGKATAERRRPVIATAPFSHRAAEGAGHGAATVSPFPPSGSARLRSRTRQAARSPGTRRRHDGEQNSLLPKTPSSANGDAPSRPAVRGDRAGALPSRLRRGLERAEGEVERIAADAREPTFDNTIAALERSGRMLKRVGGVFFTLPAPTPTMPCRRSSATSRRCSPSTAMRSS
jgi:hypothetical protein